MILQNEKDYLNSLFFLVGAIQILQAFPNDEVFTSFPGLKDMIVYNLELAKSYSGDNEYLKTGFKDVIQVFDITR
jgi:hypothetical protein